jgi:hypothetical protein
VRRALAPKYAIANAMSEEQRDHVAWRVQRLEFSMRPSDSCFFQRLQPLQFFGLDVAHFFDHLK